jgi:hypothetical protein
MTGFGLLFFLALGGIVILVNLLAAGAYLVRLIQLDTHNESNSLDDREAVGPDATFFLLLLDDVYRDLSALQVTAFSIC